MIIINGPNTTAIKVIDCKDKNPLFGLLRLLGLLINQNLNRRRIIDCYINTINGLQISCIWKKNGVDMLDS